MKYIPVIFREAFDDAQRNFDRLARHSALGAASWYTAFLSAATVLADEAENHPLHPLGKRLKISLQSKPFRTRRGKTYELLYRIVGAEVHILRVRSPGQRPVRRNDLP